MKTGTTPVGSPKTHADICKEIAAVFKDDFMKQFSRKLALDLLLPRSEKEKMIMDYSKPIRFWNRSGDTVTWERQTCQPGGSILIPLGYSIAAPGHQKSTVEEIAPQLVPDPEDKARCCIQAFGATSGQYKITYRDPDVGDFNFHEGTLHGAAKMAYDSALMLLTDLYRIAAQEDRKLTLNEIRAAVPKGGFGPTSK